MKIMKLYFIMVVIFTLSVLTLGCSKSVASPLQSPNKIVVQKAGKEIVVPNNSPEFARIFELTKNRLPSEAGQALMAMDPDNWDEWIKKQKLGIEFKYDAINKFGNDTSFTRVYFPLDDAKSSEFGWFGDDRGKILPGPIGPLKTSKELVDYIEKIQ